MSEASALATWMQANLPTKDLATLTRYRSSGSDVDTAVLESACTRGIAWFRQMVTTYSPDTNDLHSEVAATFTMFDLCKRNMQMDLAKQYWSTAQTLLKSVTEDRQLTPQSSSPIVRAAPRSTKPAFGEDFFDGWTDQS